VTPSSSTTANLADLILPGAKDVRHELVLEDGPAWKDWVFVGYPMHGFRGLERLHPGEPFRFSSKYGTRLYAARPDEPLPAELDDAWKSSHPSSAPPVEQVRFVGLWNPLARIETRARVDGVDGAAIQLTVTGETREHAWPPFLNWAVPVVLVACGVWLLLRRRRRMRSA